MRSWVLIALAGCSYAPASVSGDPVDAPKPIDQPVAIDTAIDQPTTSAVCLAHATATSPAGHHYFLTANGSFGQCQAECVSFEGHLVKIEDATEDTFVTTLAGGTFTWIGLSDPNDNDRYQWTDTTPLATADYNGFLGGTIPADGSNNCVDSNGTWDTFGCNSSNHGGVCECE